MKSDKPKHVNVLGLKYKIKYVTKTTLLRLLGVDCYGFVNTETDTIYILVSLEGDKFKQTLYHEISHCVLHRVGADQVISHELQEILCESFANVFGAEFTKINKSVNKGKLPPTPDQDSLKI